MDLITQEHSSQSDNTTNFVPDIFVVWSDNYSIDYTTTVNIRDTESTARDPVWPCDEVSHHEIFLNHKACDSMTHIEMSNVFHLKLHLFFINTCPLDKSDLSFLDFTINRFFH